MLVADGQIAEIGPKPTRSDDADDVIDATGRSCCPVSSICTPTCAGRAANTPEDIETGSAAAALGGYTAVFAMANTDPVADSLVVTDHVWRRGQQVGLVDVHPVGAVTVGLEGQGNSPRDGFDGGRVAQKLFSDDGICVHDPLVMRRALSTPTGSVDRPARRGAAPDGRRGCPRGRQRRLARAGWMAAGRRGVDRGPRCTAGPRRRRAGAYLATPRPREPSRSSSGPKQQGIAITAEVTPHHLMLDDSRLVDYDGRDRSTLRCAKPATPTRCAARWPTGSSTAWPPTTPRTPNREVLASSRWPVRACSACRPRCRWWPRPWWDRAC